MIPKYFLSYKRQDANEVKIIASELLIHGISVWQDLRNLKTGLSETQIRRAIQKECSGLIFFSTKKSVRSPVILKIELPEAEARHKKNPAFHIVPIFKLDTKTTDSALKGTITIPISNFNGIKVRKGRKTEVIPRAASETAELILRTIKLKRHSSARISIASKQKVTKDVCLAIDCRHLFENGLPLQSDWDDLKKSLLKLKDCLVDKNINRLQISAFAHLSLAFLFGYIFRETTGFILEIEQRNEIWSTLKRKGKNPLKVKTYPGTLSSKNLCVKINLVARDDTSLNDYARQSKFSYRALLEVTPPSYPFSISDKDAYVVAKELATQIKQAHARFGTNRVHIFSAIPFGLALFIGYCLNASGKIQCHEFHNINRKYSPSCCLE